jgi:hypothetical protein
MIKQGIEGVVARAGVFSARSNLLAGREKVPAIWGLLRRQEQAARNDTQVELRLP